MMQQRPLDYAGRIIASRELAWRWHVILATALVVYYGIIMAVMVLIVPHFNAVFADMKISLPALTATVVRTSSWCRQPTGLIVTMALPLALLCAGMVVDSQSPTPERARRYAIISILAATLLTAILACGIVVAMAIPMMELETSLAR